MIDAGRIKHAGDLMHKSIGSNGLAIPSNWRLSADGLQNVVWTPESASAVSYGSNVNDIGPANAPGASSLVTRADHVHRGVRTILSNGSNALFGDITIQAGTGVILSVSGNTITVSASPGGDHSHPNYLEADP